MNREILKPIVPSKRSENKVDQQHIDQCAESVKERRSVELQLARNLISLIRDAGYEPIADNMSDDDAEATGTDDELIECLFACDEARLWAKQGEKSYWMHLVMGNDGWDLLADYHMHLEPVVDDLFEWLDEQQEAASK